MPTLDQLQRRAGLAAFRGNTVGDLLRRLGVEPSPPRRELPPQLIEDLARQEGEGFLLNLGQALTFLGDRFRGFLADRPGERVTPRELLREFDAEPEAEFDITNLFGEGGLERLGAGLKVLGTDIVTDPLTLLAGIGQLGRGAKAVSQAATAVDTARDLGRLSRGILPRTSAQTGIARTTSPLARTAPRRVNAAGRLAPARPEVRDLILQQRQRARELLESIPGRQRPAELFRGRVPQIQRAGRVAARRAPGEGRSLLQVGIPFLPRTNVRLPILPRRLEQTALAPIERGLRGARRGLQRTFGRGIPESTRGVFRFLGEGTKRTAAEIGRAIEQQADHLVGLRAVAQGGTVDDVTDAIRQQFNVDIRNAREGSAAAVTREEKLFADDLNTIVDSITESQIAAGARNEALIDNYAERILTPEARELLRQKRVKGRFLDFMRRRSRIYEGSQTRRRNYLRDRLTTDANEFLRRHIPELRGNWFDLNPATTVEAAVRDRSMSTLQANLVSSLVDNFGGLPGKAGDMPIAEFFRDVSLKAFRGARWQRNNLDEITRALESAGVDTATTVPREIVKEVQDILGILQNTTRGVWGDFLRKVYDPVASMYRLGATVPFPGFHIRNLNGNIILNAMAGVMDPRFYMRALRTYTLKDPEELSRLERLGVTNVGWSKAVIEDVARTSLDGDSFFQRLQRWFTEPIEGKRQLRDQMRRYTQWAGGRGQAIENFARLAHFYGKKAQGLTDLEAVTSVNKYLFNYGREALAPAERGFFSRLFFFWRWNRYALPLMMGQLFEHPRRFSVLGKITTQPGVERPAGIPEFILESAGIPGTVDPRTGEQRFATRLGSPFETFEFLNALPGFGLGGEPGAVGAVTEFGQEIAGNFVPPLRALLELLSGEEFFLERDINELQRGSRIGSILGEAVGEIPGLEGIGEAIGEEVPTRRPGITRHRRSPALRFLERNLPTARLTRGATGLADLVLELIDPSPGQEDRPEGFGDIIQFLSGLRTTKVDTAEEAVNRARRVLRDRARERGLRGLTGELEIPFATEKGKLDPETQRVFERLNRLRGRERL